MIFINEKDFESQNFAIFKVIHNFGRPDDGMIYTPSISEIIWIRNVRAIVVCGFFTK